VIKKIGLLILLICLAAPIAPAKADVMSAPTYIVYCPWRGGCNAYPMTQGYHSGHPAYDWGMLPGKTIYSPWPHRVQVSLAAWSSEGYAWHIRLLDNEYKLTSLFAHADRKNSLLYRTGQWVDPGSAVMISGNSGYVFGSGHLHMEVMRPPYRPYVDNIDFRYYLVNLPQLPPQPNPTPTPRPVTPTPRPTVTPVPPPPPGGSYRARVIQSCRVYSQPIKLKRLTIAIVKPPRIITVSVYSYEWLRYDGGYLRQVCVVRQ
jgi:hypothetical protein